MNIRHIVFLFTFLIVTPGCNTYASPVDTTPDTSIMLEVVPGSTDDLTLAPNTVGAETIRFDLVNYSDSNVIVRGLQMGIAHEDGSPVGIAIGIRLVDGETGESVDTDAFEVWAHSARSLAVVTDVGMYGNDRLLVTLGERAVLIRNVEIAAFGTPPGTSVPAERIANNFALGRIVHVLPPEMAPEPSGTTALVATFVPEQGILHPDAGIWQVMGTINLDSYGGDSVFRGARIHGANIGVVDELTIARDGVMVGERSTPVGACSCGTISMMEPLTVHDSEHIELVVWGRIPFAPTLTGETTFGINGSEVDAEAADGGDFSVIVSQPSESRFRILATSPVVTPQALSTTTLVNGVEQDLFRFQVSSEVAGTSLYIGSLTFRFGGFGEDGMVSDLGIRVGSSDLSPSLYRIVRTSTGIELGPDSVSGVTDQITVIFTEADGLLIAGSGHVVTLVGTPSGFRSGDALSIIFGDRMFSNGYNGIYGNMTAEGQITFGDGRSVFPLVDPIVWTTRTVGGIYTGVWELSDFETGSILSRP